MTEYSPETIAALSAAGWTPDRRIDVSKYRAAYEEYGHTIFTTVLTFLEQFGGLKLRFPHFRVPDSMDGCNFHADVWARVEPNYLREYENHIGQAVVPMGAARSEHMYLLMTAGGAMYACFEDILCFVGQDHVDALNSLCEGREWECTEVEEESPPVSSELLTTVRERLDEAGWTADRGVDVSSELTALSDRGFTTSNQAKAFLEEFCGLRIKTETEGVFDVNPRTAMTMLESSQADEISAGIHAQTLTPIGELNPGGVVIMMDDQGRVLGTLPGLPEWLVNFGSGRVTALNAIVTAAGTNWSE